MRGVLALVVCAAAVALVAPPASAADVYAYANGCHALRDVQTGRFVVRDAAGYATSAPTAAAATPFRLQATALGRYLLYGPDGRMPVAGPLGAIAPSAAPGPAADWRVADVGGSLKLTSLSSGKQLGVGALGRLAQVASTAPRWSFEPAQGCASFPEVEVNVTGEPFTGAGPTAPVRGFVDDHIHVGAFQFLGGRFHCGRPWSPYGVTVALRDCADHFPNGSAAVVENFFATGTPVGTHSPEGLAQLRGLAARRVAQPRGHLLEVDRACVAIRPAPDGQRPRREPGAVRALPAQAEQLQRDGERVQAGRGHVRAPGLHRRPVRRARQGLPPDRQGSGGGPRRDQCRQAGDGAGRGGVGGARLRPVQRCAALHPRADRRRAGPARIDRRALALPRAQVRQRPRRHALRLRHHRRARQHRQQVRHRPVLDRRALPGRGRP